MRDIDEARKILSESPYVWDMTLPWVEMYWSIDVIRRYKDAGYNYISLTIQDGVPATYEGVIESINSFKELCSQHSDWIAFPRTFEEIAEAKGQGKICLGLNVQDTHLVHEDLGLLQSLKDIGVQHMLLAYQLRNRAADGCAEPADAGLSLFGRRLVREMNRLKITVDLSHVGRRSSLDAMEVSEKPVIFSHSGVKSVCQHIRNIDDDQIKGCASMGGVIGIVGIGAFLGDPAAKNETFFRHLDHVVQLVGPAHAGIGTDFIADMKPTWAAMEGEKGDMWRDPYGTQLYEGDAFSPEQLVGLVQLMIDHGYDNESISGILGANFYRVYSEVNDAALERQDSDSPIEFDAAGM